MTLKHSKPLFTGKFSNFHIIISEKDGSVHEYDMEEFKKKYNLRFKAQENWRGHVERITENIQSDKKFRLKEKDE